MYFVFYVFHSCLLSNKLNFYNEYESIEHLIIVSRKSRIPEKKLRFLIQQITANELRHARGPVHPSDSFIYCLFQNFLDSQKMTTFNCHTQSNFFSSLFGWMVAASDSFYFKSHHIFHVHPSSHFPDQRFSLSLSLSHTHTHTHKHTYYTVIFSISSPPLFHYFCLSLFISLPPFKASL